MPKHSMHPLSGKLKGSNPDKGPAVHEGEHHFDKGYESDDPYFSPKNAYPDNMQRGNRYMENQNKIVAKDSQKLRRDQFSKIH